MKKKQTPGGRLKVKQNKLKLKRLRIFRDTLILVFVNENCRLCKCFTELYFFYRSLVVSLAILRAVLHNFQLSSFGREKMKFLKLSQMNGLDK